MTKGSRQKLVFGSFDNSRPPSASTWTCVRLAQITTKGSKRSPIFQSCPGPDLTRPAKLVNPGAPWNRRGGGINRQHLERLAKTMSVAETEIREAGQAGQD